MNIKDTSLDFPVYLSATEEELRRQYLEAVQELAKHLHSLTGDAVPFPLESDIELCKKAVPE